MTDTPSSLSRRAFFLLTAGTGIAGLFVGLGPTAAYAESGSGSGGDGRDEDEPDEADEPDEPDEPEDNSGPGGGDDGGEDNSGGDSGTAGGTQTGGQIGGQPVTPASGSGRNRLRNVTIHYPDGWVELILNDQYQLIDSLNRQVILRPATIEDFNRMVALGS